MKAYDEEKCHLGVLTLYDHAVIQSQAQKCKIFTV